MIDANAFERLYRQGARAWPRLKCSRSEMAACIAWAEIQDADSANAAGLYLAGAVVAGRAEALSSFETTHLETQRPRLAQIGLNDDDIDEVLQTVRTQLLMPRAGAAAPRLAELAGRGNLYALVRVVTIRAALNYRRSQGRRRRNEDVAAAELLSPAHRSVLRDVMSAEAVTLLRDAIEAAIAGLNAQQRTLLRLNVSHGMSIDEIGRIYNVHRATAARWLGSARDAIENDVKARLRTIRGHSTTHLNELFELASSQLQISFHRLLATAN
ncbi:MAG: ECF-type sigma factor [Myxococcota bacterium]